MTSNGPSSSAATAAATESRCVKAYVAKHGIPGDQLFDRNGKATGAYDVPATSYVVVLDKTGKVVYTGVGGDQNLEAAIKKAM